MECLRGPFGPNLCRRLEVLSDTSTDDPFRQKPRVGGRGSGKEVGTETRWSVPRGGVVVCTPIGLEVRVLDRCRRRLVVGNW